MHRRLFIVLGIIFLFQCHKEDINPDPRAGLNLPDFVQFTHLPTDLSRMAEFAAIGQMYLLPKAHGGFTLDYQQWNNKADIPVYAMSDGVIYNIRYGTKPYGDGTDYEDYALHIYLTPTAEMHFGHVGKLAPEILDQADNLVKGSTENPVSIQVQAGQIIGYIGIHPGFDIGYSDFSSLPYFAKPSRYNEHYMGSRPFTDILLPKLRDQIWRINPRTVEPRGGSIHYDKAGTLAGNWFLESPTELHTAFVENWGKIIIFGYHEKWADRIMIVDMYPRDSDPAAEPDLWWIIGNNPSPESITRASGKVKYSVATWYNFNPSNDLKDPSPEGIFMVELTSETTLKVEFFPGKLSAEIDDFTENVRLYER